MERSGTFLAAWYCTSQTQSETVGAALTNVAIRKGAENLSPNILVFQGAADLDLVTLLMRIFL